MQRLKIFHETEYLYANPVKLGRHKVLVRPRDGHDIRIEASMLSFSPNALVSWHRDELDNSVALATFEENLVDRLVITSEVVVAHYLSDRLTVPLLDRAMTFPFEYLPEERSTLAAYLKPYTPTSVDSPGEVDRESEKTLKQWLVQLPGNAPTVELLNSLSSCIYDAFTYQLRDEPGVQSPGETLALGTGSCRDYAWFFVVACRSLGLAARFVSGYFNPAGTSLTDGATHAWAEVYLPGAGWTGFDPTCNRMTAENHVPVSVALMPVDVPPVSGSYFGNVGEQPVMNVTVHVTPVD